MNGICPLCNRAVPDSNAHSGKDGMVTWPVSCKTCGDYRIEDLTRDQIEKGWAAKEQKHILRGFTKEEHLRGTRAVIDGNLLARIGKGDLRERAVDEKLELIVRWFAQQSKEIGAQVLSVTEDDYPVGWCRSAAEWDRLMRALVRDFKYLEGGGSHFSVSVDGWRWLSKKPVQASGEAFIAMNFAEEYTDLRQAICDAVERAGYAPVIIDKSVFDGGVMDHVLAGIRQCRFVVADYSGNRGGVYYEAGFALGLGKLVLHLCSQEQLDAMEKSERLHFDVQHLKIIPWSKGALDVFSRDLEAHICALLDQGPHLRQI